MIPLLTRYRQRKKAQRLQGTLKPDPAYWQRRLRQLSPERRMRQIMSARMHSPELFK